MFLGLSVHARNSIRELLELRNGHKWKITFGLLRALGPNRLWGMMRTEEEVGESVGEPQHGARAAHHTRVSRGQVREMLHSQLITLARLGVTSVQLCSLGNVDDVLFLALTDLDRWGKLPCRVYQTISAELLFSRGPRFPRSVDAPDLVLSEGVTNSPGGAAEDPRPLLARDRVALDTQHIAEVYSRPWLDICLDTKTGVELITKFFALAYDKGFRVEIGCSQFENLLNRLEFHPRPVMKLGSDLREWRAEEKRLKQGEARFEIAARESGWERYPPSLRAGSLVRGVMEWHGSSARARRRIFGGEYETVHRSFADGNFVTNVRANADEPSSDEFSDDAMSGGMLKMSSPLQKLCRGDKHLIYLCGGGQELAMTGGVDHECQRVGGV